jgi:hypothetical protein
MANPAGSTAIGPNIITAEIRQTAPAGTALAIIDTIQSCGLVSCSGPAAKRDRAAPPRRGRAFREAAKGTWGGARNHADRVSFNLSRRQCEGLVAAASAIEKLSKNIDRHWTVHYERAGIADCDGAAFVRRFLKRAGEHVRRSGGSLAAIWVRENGDGKGAHVHILLSLPTGMTLRNLTRRWIIAAGGRYRKGVSEVRTIGGTLASARTNLDRHEANVGNVLAYLLKGADAETGRQLGLERYGEGGPIIGKRCGWTQNLGRAARRTVC